MNQRFQNEEIKSISRLYSDDELYLAISSIGPQLEAELTNFGLCAEECFTEVREILEEIANLDDANSLSIDRLWLFKHNEYRRLDRSVPEEETRKVVGIIFAFVIIAMSSSHYFDYNDKLPRLMLECIAKHEFKGWATTLDRIFDVQLTDAWFDHYVLEEEQASDKEEQKSCTSLSLARSNIIFSPRIFTSEIHYELLRKTILAFIHRKDEKEEEVATDCHYQITPETQAEWYYILKAISEAKVAKQGKLSDINFLRQMQSWYPTLFTPKNENEDTQKMLRRYASSISVERKKWSSGMEKKEVSIRDMFAHSNTLGYEQSKTLRQHGVALELKEQLQALTQSVSSK